VISVFYWSVLNLGIFLLDLESANFTRYVDTMPS